MKYYQSRLKEWFEQNGTPLDANHVDPLFNYISDENSKDVYRMAFGIRNGLRADPLFGPWKYDVQLIMNPLSPVSLRSDERIQEVSDMYEQRYREDHELLLKTKDSFILFTQIRASAILDPAPTLARFVAVWLALKMTEVCDSILRPMNLGLQLWEYRQIGGIQDFPEYPRYMDWLFDGYQ